MNRTEKLIDTIARLNPDAGEIGAGMLATLVAEAKAIQAEASKGFAPGGYIGPHGLDLLRHIKSDCYDDPPGSEPNRR